MVLRSAVLCTTEMASYLPPSRGDSQPSPVTVVGIARHCGRVLGQARALGRLSHGVKTCFPHRCALPQPGAPLLLGARQTTAAATVQSVHLPDDKKRGKNKFILCFSFCFQASVWVYIHVEQKLNAGVCAFSACAFTHLNENERH